MDKAKRARISKQANTDPTALLGYLDRFVDIQEDHTEEEKARDELLSIQGEIEKATTKVDLIPQYERMLSTTQQQLAALKQAKAEDVIELQRKLAEEREVQASISRKLTGVREDINTLSPKTLTQEIEALANPKDLAVGSSEFEKILESAKVFKREAKTAQDQAKAGYDVFKKVTETELASWKAKEAIALKTIEDKRKNWKSKTLSSTWPIFKNSPRTRQN